LRTSRYWLLVLLQCWVSACAAGPRKRAEHRAGPYLQTGVGVQGLYGGETWMTGLSGLAAVDTSSSDELYARLDTRLNYDFRDQEIDLSRHSLWFDGRLQGGFFPITAVDNGSASMRFGVRGELAYLDNSPTSVDVRWRGVAGPACRIDVDRMRLGFLLGAHATDTELDDDLPATRGIPRSELHMYTHGMAMAMTIEMPLQNEWIFWLTGRLLLDPGFQVAEGEYGAALDVPLTAPGYEGARHFLRISADHSRVDPDDQGGALPFHHDGFVRIEIVSFFGGRSFRSFGY